MLLVCVHKSQQPDYEEEKLKSLWFGEFKTEMEANEGEVWVVNECAIARGARAFDLWLNDMNDHCMSAIHYKNKIVCLFSFLH